MGGATKSEEVVQIIMKMHDRCVCVRGNREKYIIEGIPLTVHDEKMKVSTEQLQRNEYIKEQLTESSINYIKRLPKEMYCDIDGKKIYIVHYPMNDNGEFKKHIKKSTLSENKEMFKNINADIYLYGHTHEKNYNSDEKSIYINPGPLGCPGHTNYAQCGVLNIQNNAIEYEQLEVEYDAEKVIADIESDSFPGYEHVLKIFYGDRRIKRL